jgi:hypothetical protein
MKRLMFVLLVALIVAACDFSMPITNTNNPTAPTNPTPTPTPVVAPVINYFTSDTMAVKVGATVVVRWDITGTPPVDVTITPTVGSVPQTGVAQFVATVTTTYTLTAKNSAGIVTRTLTITVTP